MALTFSGHESFPCKSFWLKKGYDFLQEGGDFNAEEAVVQLGVGKNMVRSIRFWLKAFGVVDENQQITEWAHLIFDESNGADPYLEDIGTLWLLHYKLATQGVADIYQLTFNHFLAEPYEFTEKALEQYLTQVGKNEGQTLNANTLKRDVQVFGQTYLGKKASKAEEIEDTYASILVDLPLFHRESRQVRSLQDRMRDDHIELLATKPGTQPELPKEILLYAILRQYSGRLTITLDELRKDPNGPGKIFLLTQEGLYDKIRQLEDTYTEYIRYSETAGNAVMQFQEKMAAQEVLKHYYHVG
ncbi:MAG TPA: DUF4007 domain-containing protein [Cytophagales bacterium]|nr:DUF4007 domain-containing protein [Cytophagales bacterium]HAA19459.1 DUF4007 domain-containing protein [Cytophagales bacterium]HAP58682.1 DUF4007 domain-containing protein [Cytophagales bacterium]